MVLFGKYEKSQSRHGRACPGHRRCDEAHNDADALHKAGQDGRCE